MAFLLGVEVFLAQETAYLCSKATSEKADSILSSTTS